MSYSVVPADLDADREAILEVKRRSFPSSPCSRERFEWYYQGHPVGPGRCWLLIARPGDVPVGMAGLTMRRLQIGSSTITAGLTSDLAVDPEHRSALPALMLQKAVIAALHEELPVIYGTPNKKSVGIFKRVGYRDVSGLGRWVKPLRSGPYLDRLSGPARMARHFEKAVDLAWRAMSGETWQGMRGLTLTRLPAFDSRFDSLWEHAAPAFPMLAERRAAVLEWRYNRCPGQAFTTVGLLANGGERLLGYAVYEWEGEHANCTDLFAAPEALPVLIAALTRRVRAERAASLSMQCSLPPFYQETLKRFGFTLRASEDPLPLVAIHAPEFHGLSSLTPSDWFYFQGDRNFN